MAKRKQLWFCLDCAKVGMVELDEHIGVIEGSEKVRADHKRITPLCDSQGVRIVNLEDMLKKAFVLNWVALGIADLLPSVPEAEKKKKKIGRGVQM